MTAIPNRTHAIKSEIETVYPKQIFTFCGKFGFFTGTKDEYHTLTGDYRFAATKNTRDVNCRRCLSAARGLE